MTVHAPVHPDVGPTRDPEKAHEPLDDVLETEGSSRSQRLIAWVCALLTVVAVYAVWRLL